MAATGFRCQFSLRFLLGFVVYIAVSMSLYVCCQDYEATTYVLMSRPYSFAETTGFNHFLRLRNDLHRMEWESDQTIGVAVESLQSGRDAKWIRERLRIDIDCDGRLWSVTVQNCRSQREALATAKAVTDAYAKARHGPSDERRLLHSLAERCTADPALIEQFLPDQNPRNVEETERALTSVNALIMPFHTDTFRLAGFREEAIPRYRRFAFWQSLWTIAAVGGAILLRKGRKRY